METKALQQAKDYVAQLNGYSNWERISYTEIADFERASLIDDVQSATPVKWLRQLKKKLRRNVRKRFAVL